MHYGQGGAPLDMGGSLLNPSFGNKAAVQRASSTSVYGDIFLKRTKSDMGRGRYGFRRLWIVFGRGLASGGELSAWSGNQGREGRGTLSRRGWRHLQSATTHRAIAFRSESTR